MRVLLLGVGMQGKAALHDLVAATAVDDIVAADADLDKLESFVESRDWRGKVRCEHLDAANSERLDQLLDLHPDVVIDLLPTRFLVDVARAAITHRVHLVNTFYVPDGLSALHGEARARDVTILPEFGLDPGIDLVMLGEAARALDTIEEMHSYGAGIPEREAADNPLHYKVSWTFEGVLAAYRRAARRIRDGAIEEVAANDVFSPHNVHEVDMPGVGTLEAFLNGDAVPYVGVLGLDPAALAAAGRYSMRWPGHCALWKSLMDLHLLDHEPVEVDGFPVDRLRFLAEAIGPHIQYRPGERDLALVRVDVIGTKSGRRRRLRYELTDRLDRSTGLSAMSRTVGFTAAIGALMIGDGRIHGRGVLSPVRDVPYDAFVSELASRGVVVTCNESDA